MNLSKRVLVVTLTLGAALVCAGSKAQAQEELTSSANPSVAGKGITLSTEACDNAKDYQVSFYWGTSEGETPSSLIGTASGFRPYTINWTPPAAETYYLYAEADTPGLCEYSSNILKQVVSPAISAGSFDDAQGDLVNREWLFALNIGSVNSMQARYIF